MKSFYVKHFDDYHEIAKFRIRANALKQTAKTKLKSHELACLHAKGYEYARYFAVFWNGDKPPCEEIAVQIVKAGFEGSVLRVVASSHRQSGYYAAGQMGSYNEIDFKGFK